MIDNIVKFLTQKLTLEEKLLCLIPIIGFYIDLFITFIACKTSTTLMIREFNSGLNQAVGSGPIDLLIFVILTSIIIFISFTFIIYILKYVNANTKIMYAVIFTYFGLRIDGAWSWFI